MISLVFSGVLCGKRYFRLMRMLHILFSFCREVSKASILYFGMKFLDVIAGYFVQCRGQTRSYHVKVKSFKINCHFRVAMVMCWNVPSSSWDQSSREKRYSPSSSLCFALFWWIGRGYCSFDCYSPIHRLHEGTICFWEVIKKNS